MNDLSCGIRMWAQVSFVLSQSMHLTDGQKGLSDTVHCVTCSFTLKAYNYDPSTTIAIALLLVDLLLQHQALMTSRVYGCVCVSCCPCWYMCSIKCVFVYKTQVLCYVIVFSDTDGQNKWHILCTSLPLTVLMLASQGILHMEQWLWNDVMDHCIWH